MIFSLQPPWLKMICFVAIYTTSYLLNGDASRAYRIDGDLFIRSSPPITYQNGYISQQRKRTNVIQVKICQSNHRR